MNRLKQIKQKLKDGFIRDAIRELKFIYFLLGDHKKGIVLYTGTTLFAVLVSLSISVQMQGLVDSIVDQNWNGVIRVAVYYVVVGSFNVLLATANQRISAVIGARAKTELAMKTYDKILIAEWEGISTHHSGDLLARIQEDINTISGSTVGWIPSILAQGLQILVSVGIIIYYDPSMLLMIIIVAPLILFSSRIFLGKMYASNRRQREVTSDLMSLYKESFQHLQSIKGFGLLDHFHNKMQQQQELRQEVDLKVNKYSLASWYVMYSGGQIAAIICLGWAIYQVFQGRLTLGTMTLMVMIASNLASSFKSMIQLIPTAVTTISASERIRELLELPEEHVEMTEPYKELLADASESGVSVVMKDISFRYRNGRQVFDQIECEINKGEIVAFVGPSGEGKTTLLRILLGLIRPTGEYLLKTDSCELPFKEEIRGVMTYVPQGNTILSGTIADNLRLLNPDATEEEMVEVLKEAGAYEFVQKLPDGIYHKIGENGIGFSEGQNQRLAIARALMSKAPILLLDEATSALDVATERKILSNIMKKDKNRTCILTTHRPSALGICNRVYRIDQCKVRQIGEEDIRELMNEF